MLKLKSAARSVLKFFASKIVRAVVSVVDFAGEKKFLTGDVDLKISEGTRVLSLKVWTEGEKQCPKHVYMKARVPNSHKNAAMANNGGEHTDYICMECTHRMCVTEWASK